MDLNKKAVILAGIGIIAGVVTIAISIYPSLFAIPKPAGTVEQEDNNVLIDMTTQQWKFLPTDANPKDDRAKLSSVPNGDKFADTTISVKKGTVLTLRIKNLDVGHGFGIDEFSINKVTPPGQVTLIKFTASKEGTFTFYCTIFCGTGHPKHKGTLLVEA